MGQHERDTECVPSLNRLTYRVSPPSSVGQHPFLLTVLSLFYILTYSQYQPLTHFIPQACLTSSRPYGMTVFMIKCSCGLGETAYN